MVIVVDEYSADHLIAKYWKTEEELKHMKKPMYVWSTAV